MLGMEKDPVKAMLSHSDKEHLEALFAEVGSLSPDKLTKLVGIYVEHIYRLNLAETLDVIGLCEAISNTNLFVPGVKSSLVVQQSQILKSLLSFTADLKI
jgi:hypothetical protein